MRTFWLHCPHRPCSPWCTYRGQAAMACPTHSGTWRRYADAVSVDAPNRSKPWGAPRDDLQGE
ncbi:MAG: hypothetical protein EBQ56_08870 [Proteobacteria bacterium]|nr:hypothetical protein [Pseudomonadota bacterium]NBY47866.1 hypothetical protein [Pseudomonadota bacterium]NDF55813.1 hypothetical protein [Pseudomonadota bacterium]HAN16011.1 hypothetical protein [Chloroflexota bacterium]